MEAIFPNLWAEIDDAALPLVAGPHWRLTERRNKNGTVTYYALRMVKVNGKRVSERLHRVVLGLLPGDPRDVAHIDGNGLNCRRSNLIIVPVGSIRNHVDCRKRLGTSKFRGVCWHDQRKKWRAKIKVAGKNKYLGLFTSELDAARCYDRAAIQYHGEGVRLNFPMEQDSIAYA